jgi:hypothetical protein
VSRQLVLASPLHGLLKLGTAAAAAVVQAMQALSHFSYHKTGGQLVLCDLQGGIMSRGRGAVLTGMKHAACAVLLQ